MLFMVAMPLLTLTSRENHCYLIWWRLRTTFKQPGQLCPALLEIYCPLMSIPILDEDQEGWPRAWLRYGGVDAPVTRISQAGRAPSAEADNHAKINGLCHGSLGQN